MNGSTKHTLSPVAAGLLIGAPLLMVVARLLAVPFDDQDWNKVLDQAAASQARSDAGWILAAAASGLLGASMLFLAQLLRALGRRGAAGFVTVSGALGWAGAAGICAAGLYFGALGKSADRQAQVQVLTDMNSGSTQYIFLMCVLAAIGYVTLAIGLVRSGILGKGAAFLLGLGGAGTLLLVPGPVIAMNVVAALLLLAGHVFVLRSVGVDRSESAEPRWESVAA